MPMFRKKPVTIEARHYDGTEDCAYDLIDWIDQTSTVECRRNANFDCYDDSVVIEQGNDPRLSARPGEWIIRGVEGEFYPCPASVFAATYDPA